MDGNDRSNITMCPVMHAKAGVRSNSDWWPNQLNVKISDDLSGISSYRATINGKLILMEYEYKTDLLSYSRFNRVFWSVCITNAVEYRLSSFS